MELTTRMPDNKPLEIAHFVTHPFQYFAPLYRELARNSEVHLIVYFEHIETAGQYFDSGFGGNVEWDIPLLSGYDYEVVPGSRSPWERWSAIASLVTWIAMMVVAKREYRFSRACLWQVSGRNRISNFDDWVRPDLEYIRTRSMWLDCKILARTARVVARGTGY